MSLNHILSVGYYLQSANLLLRQVFLYATEIVFAFHFHFRDEGFFLFCVIPFLSRSPPPSLCYWFQKLRDQFKLSVTELLCVFSKVSLFPCSFSNSLLCTKTEALMLSVSEILLGEAVSKITSLCGLITVYMIALQLAGREGGGKGNNYPPNIRS